MTTGYARLSPKTAYHLFAPHVLNRAYLAPACGHTSLLRSDGAKLKTRTDLPAGAWICTGCARKANAS